MPQFHTHRLRNGTPSILIPQVWTHKQEHRQLVTCVEADHRPQSALAGGCSCYMVMCLNVAKL